MLQKAVDKYIADKNPDRINAILISHKIKPTKQNIKAFKIVLDDYAEDKDLHPLQKFLGLEIKEELPPVVLEDIKPNDDDFVNTVIQMLGDPKDTNSLGNKIYRGEIFRGTIKSYIKPDILLKKYAILIGKEPLEIEYYPRLLKGGAPTWEFVISGMGSLVRGNTTKVN